MDFEIEEEIEMQKYEKISILFFSCAGCRCQGGGGGCRDGLCWEGGSVPDNSSQSTTGHGSGPQTQGGGASGKGYLRKVRK